MTESSRAGTGLETWIDSHAHLSMFDRDEISDVLGISSGTSKSQLHRARMLLRKHLDQ